MGEGGSEAAGDVHVFGVHPLLWAHPDGKVHGQAADASNAAESEADRVASGDANTVARAGARTIPLALPGIGRPLSLLRRYLQLRCAEAVPFSGKAHLVQGSAAPRSKEAVEVVAVRPVAGGVSAPETDHLSLGCPLGRPSDWPSTRGSCGLPWDRSPPGAGCGSPFLFSRFAPAA